MSLTATKGGSFTMMVGDTTVGTMACLREAVTVGGDGDGQMFLGILRFNSDTYVRIASREEADSLIEAIRDVRDQAFAPDADEDQGPAHV